MQTVKEWNTKQTVNNNNEASVSRVPKSRQPLPKVKALYDYNPQDLDELELKEGDVIEVLKERRFLIIGLIRY